LLDTISKFSWYLRNFNLFFIRNVFFRNNND
jgi:hypothetical protein